MSRMPVSRLIFALLLVMMNAGVVLAQQAPAAAPTQTVGPLPKDSQGWLAVVMCIVLVIAVCVGSFMSSKRTHQD